MIEQYLLFYGTTEKQRGWETFRGDFPDIENAKEFLVKSLENEEDTPIWAQIVDLESASIVWVWAAWVSDEGHIYYEID